MRSLPRILVGVLVVIATATVARAQTVPLGPWSVGGPVVVFPASGMTSAGVVTSPQGLYPDGTSPLPAIAFASQPTLGFWKSATSNVTMNGSLTVTGTFTSAVDLLLGATGFLHFTGRGGFDTGANGNFRVQVEAGTIGSLLKVDALPAVSACGAGSPAVVAGSTPLSGAVTVGTGAPATCTITFGGTAYPQIPHCSGAVETTTAANARAMGYSSSTTVLTIVPSAAWADSSVVNWTCMSPKS